LRRGVQIISPASDFGLKSLAEILPEIVISACPAYIDKMKVPYQATSFLGAATAKIPDTAKSKNLSPLTYVYKLPGKKAGGVPLLTRGKRKIGDSVFAATHRILLGSNAIVVSALNLMANKDKIWNWKFFGKYVKESSQDVYRDLTRLNEVINKKKRFCQVVVARSDSTFRKLKIVEHYFKNKIAILDQTNDIKVIFLTNQNGYDYASKSIPESNLVDYIVTGEQFDYLKGLEILRKEFRIKIMLNDGGRLMSNGLRDLGLLAEERITLEPFPGKKIMPDSEKLDPTSIIAMDGTGIDGNELEQAIRISSTEIGDERANVYSYVLNEGLIK
jgi:hypothetical protein